MFALTRVFMGGALLASMSLVSAQSLAGVVQVLDSVDAFGGIENTESSTVLEMGFRDPLPRKDFSRLALGPASQLIACQRAADQGLYCLDGPVVRYWPNTANVDPATGVIPDTDLINCRQSAAVLGLDRRAASPCTSLTVDLNGALWLAGRKANSHSLFKVIERTGASCPAAYVELPQVTQQDAPTPPGEVVPFFCAREYAFGRPVLVDINPVDGEVAGSFTSPMGGGPGILGLEERKTVVFFPDSAGGNPLEPDEIASGKSDWSLIGNEQLLSASVLQIQEIPPAGATLGVPLQNFVIAATTSGRVMATKSDGSQAAFEVWRAPTCASRETQQYGIRVSSQSERVYLSDRACQKVYALKWTGVADGSFTLQPATEGTPPQEVALATKSTSTSVLPDGLSVAPGIGVDLRDCGFNADGSPKTCPWVPDGTDENGFNGAEVSGVRIEPNGKSNMTVFQVLGIPDCRYWPDGPGCDPSLVDGDTPETSRLNITELLPQEVKLQYPATGEGSLPPLWISAKYRGQVNKAGHRTIDLFWAIPEPGVQFRDTFRMSFDVGDLTNGVKNGCGGGTTLQPDVDWNVIITGSEKYEVVDGSGVNRSNVGDPYVPEAQIKTGYTETLVNDGCSNPDGVSSKRFSYYAYNMELTPDRDDGQYSDGIYARMVLSQFDDILSTQRKTACEQFDPSADGNAPLDSTQCANLEQKWFGADDKLKKCITGTTFPRQSEAVNNCNSFVSQLAQYESALNAAPRLGQDPANRIGELKARVKVLRYVFQQHFVPSIPPNGFCSLAATGTCTP